MAGDMLVNLTTLPQLPSLPAGIKLKRAFPGDKNIILDFIKNNFQESWRNEAEYALMQNPPACFVATENGKLLGFACYDASAKGFFGPIGVLPSERGKGIGAALLIHTLEAMRAAGYGYSIIGWVDGPEEFYEKVVNAQAIVGGEPQNSVYSRYIFM